MQAMKIAEIIALLGSRRQVANDLAVDHTRVWRWEREGIPPQRWVAVSNLAKSQGHNHITLDVIAAAERTIVPENKNG